MKILVISPHPEGFAPGQRLKYEQYFEYFKKNDIEVIVSPFISEKFLKIIYRKGYILHKIYFTISGYFQRIKDIFRIKKYDGLYIFLYVTPFGPPIFEWVYTKIQPNFIYDIDDLVYLKRKNRENPIAEKLRGRSKIPFLIKRAKHVITCTPYLDDYAKNFNLNTTDISSTIDTDKYIPKIKKVESLNITIGWSGSHSTVNYLNMLGNVLHQIQAKYGVKILVIGDASFSITNVSVEAINWSLSTEVEDLKRIDIGLYPLPDEKWVYGKSGLKALQYMALGIPTIATAVGANFRIIEDGISGFLVENEIQWYNTIEKLILNPNLRTEIGLRGRERVEKFYSIKANRDKYLNILKSL